ncbi:MAG: hypothetical protein ACFNX9_03700, partial [Eikenella corrodens]|uniref:hypothetical protein n=1 Tax=Eikenella corrodens TaxID=539 RepID=UPI00362284D2
KTPTLIGNLIVKELLNQTGDKQIAPCGTAKMRTIRLKKNFVKYLKIKYPTNKIKPLTQNRISLAENCATPLPLLLLTLSPAKSVKYTLLHHSIGFQYEFPIPPSSLHPPASDA